MSGFEEIGTIFRFDSVDEDSNIRSEAFAEVRRISQISGALTSRDLAGGFQYRGKRIPFVNPQRGIFKPRQMAHLLSIKTVFPRPGRKVWYDDQRQVHQQIYGGEETIEYAFMGTDPNAADNRWLYDAMVSRVKVIYFLGVAPGLYQAVFPTFIVGFDPISLRAKIAFGESEFAKAPPVSAIERRYALRMVQQRLHQTSFREMVISAYRGRCAISRLPEPLLLDAAHIISDGDEKLGQPLITNGLPLSKIHHAAFDKHLIGIDADCRIHVSRQLLDLRDGPTAEALRQFEGAKLLAPYRAEDAPDRDRLSMRFQQFRARA